MEVKFTFDNITYEANQFKLKKDGYGIFGSGWKPNAYSFSGDPHAEDDSWGETSQGCLVWKGLRGKSHRYFVLGVERLDRETIALSLKDRRKAGRLMAQLREAGGRGRPPRPGRGFGLRALPTRVPAGLEHRDLLGRDPVAAAAGTSLPRIP